MPDRPAWTVPAAAVRVGVVGLVVGGPIGRRVRTRVSIRYHLLPATRADLLRRLQRFTEAAASNREALDLGSTDAERRYLARRLAETTARA